MNRIIRRGQSLVEFAVIALVLYMLLAAILTFGHLLYVAQGLQSAADLAAREISRTPFSAFIVDDETGEPHALRFDDMTQISSNLGTKKDNDLFRIRIFDEAWLVIDLATFYAENPGGSVFEILVPQMPLLNQQLAMMMIVDRPDFNGDGNPDAWLLRYPGALLSRQEPISPPKDLTYDSAVATNFSVGIPLITAGGEEGLEAIRWIPVIEEIGDGSFAIDSPQRGIVALRINYPFQSASMSSFRPNPAGPFEPTIGQPNAADDGDDEDDDRLTGAPLVSDNGIYAGTYGGQYGLGAQGAFGTIVRPYRRVLSAQAIYRREIFD